MPMYSIPIEAVSLKESGRIRHQDGTLYLGYSGSQIGFSYAGNRLEAAFVTDEYCAKDPALHAWIGVHIGHEKNPYKRFALTQNGSQLLFDKEEYAASLGLPLAALPKEIDIRVTKYSEAAFGIVGITELLVDTASLEAGAEATFSAADFAAADFAAADFAAADFAEAASDSANCLAACKALFAPLPSKALAIEYYGDSITCGYGVEGILDKDVFTTAQENPLKAYAIRSADLLDADYSLISWSGIGFITDYIPPEVDEPCLDMLMPELYPNTNTRLDRYLGLPEEAWDFTKFMPDAVVINLGTNDASYTRGIQSRIDAYISAYETFLDFLRAKYDPKVDIVSFFGIMDQALCPMIEEMTKKRTAEGDAHLHYVQADLQQESDGIGTDNHPSPITHAKAAEKLAAKLRALLEEKK